MSICFRRINHMVVNNHLHSSSGVQRSVSGTTTNRSCLQPGHPSWPLISPTSSYPSFGLEYGPLLLSMECLCLQECRPQVKPILHVAEALPHESIWMVANGPSMHDHQGTPVDYLTSRPTSSEWKCLSTCGHWAAGSLTADDGHVGGLSM